MAELEKTGGAPKKKLPAKIITKVDITPADVVKWSQEGRKLVFDDSEFLELPSEAYSAMSLENKRSYDIVKNHVLGRDVVKDATPEAFNLPFNVRPDAPNRQLSVFGKNPGKEYHWARPDKMGYHQGEGWVVDHDSDVKTEYVESCSYKTVGGQSRPELVLMSRSKEIGTAKRTERKALRDGSVKKTQEQFLETAKSLGIKAISE